MTEQPELAPDFDLDAWIDGTTGLTSAARIVQRGDLIATRVSLEEDLRAVQNARRIERSITDRGAESIRAELEEINRQIWASSIVVTIQDRTIDHRKAVRAKIIEEVGLDQKADAQRYNYVLLLAEIADAVIKVETPEGKTLNLGPDGFGWQRLDAIRERCGEAALIELLDRYREMTSNAPAVQAPFSPPSSSAHDGITSP